MTSIQVKKKCDETVTDDLLCVRCGYNLRGLSADGRCPECGAPVTQSTRGDLLSAADPAWLGSVCRGQSYIAIACVLLLVGLPVVIAIDTVFDNFLDTNPSIRRSLTLVPGLLCLGFLLPGIIGVTTLDPRLTLAEQPVALRRMTRIAAFLTLLLCIAYYIGAPAAQPVATGYLTARAIVGLASFLGLATTAIAASHYLARLAERIPDVELARRMRATARRFGVCFLIAVVAYAVLRLSGFRGPIRYRESSGPVIGFITVLQLVSSLAALVYAVGLAATWIRYRKAVRSCLLAAKETAEP